MARHNYLLQRHIGGPSGVDANCAGKGAEWRDLGTARTVPVPDAYGNTGYNTRKQAVAAVKRCRRDFPGEAYRIIQIIS